MSKDNFVAMTRCYYCGEGKDIIIHKRFGDLSRINNKVVDKRPCPKCEEWMKQGVILISVRDGEEGDNPYRTGGFCVMKDEAVRRVFSGDVVESMLHRRCAFIPDSVAKHVGLFTDDKGNYEPGSKKVEQAAPEVEPPKPMARPRTPRIIRRGRGGES